MYVHGLRFLDHRHSMDSGLQTHKTADFRFQIFGAKWRQQFFLPTSWMGWIYLPFVNNYYRGELRATSSQGPPV